jgi:hypothetical protein
MFSIKKTFQTLFRSTHSLESFKTGLVRSKQGEAKNAVMGL